jgi:CubicO group peptidase (beta-lactamase class C family)
MCFLLIHTFAKARNNNTESLIDSIFKDYIHINGPGLSVAVIKNGKIEIKRNYGLTNIEKNKSASSSTKYYMSGITNQFTALGILILNKQGKLKLSHKLTDVFKDFPAYGKRISIKTLLNHTSGLVEINLKKYIKNNYKINNQDVIQALKLNDSLKFSPGRKLDINWVNYAVLGSIIEKKSGMSYPDFLEKEIFEPLGMNESLVFTGKKKGFFAKLFGKGDAYGIDNKAIGYIPGNGDYKKAEGYQDALLYGNTGVYTTLNDYTKFLTAWNSDKLVSKNKINRAFRINYLPGVIKYYGFGWNINWFRGKTYAYQVGNDFGNTHISLFIPHKNLAVVIFSNQAGIFGLLNKALALANRYY